MNFSPSNLRLLTNDLLQQGYELHYRTSGSSMFPFILGGNRIQVEKAEIGSLRPGDIILYRSAELLVAHRLLRKEPGPVLVTRGDSFHRSAIERLLPEQVIGRVVAVDWRFGLKFRIDRGPGRRLGLLLAPISPLISWGYTHLCKLKKNFKPVAAP